MSTQNLIADLIADQAYDSVVTLHNLMTKLMVVDEPGTTIVLKLEEIRQMRELACLAYCSLLELEEKCHHG